MTNAEQRRLTNWRLKLLLAAGEAGNVARTCRHFAISRKTFYKYLRQHYHFGPGKIVDYLKRFHSLSIACATVHRILCRHRMNRRPANQKYRRHPHPHAQGLRRVQSTHGHRIHRLLDRDGITDDIHLLNAKLKEWEDYTITTGRTGPDSVRATPGKGESRNVTGVLRTYTSWHLRCSTGGKNGSNRRGIESLATCNRAV